MLPDDFDEKGPNLGIPLRSEGGDQFRQRIMVHLQQTEERILTVSVAKLLKKIGYLNSVSDHSSG